MAKRLRRREANGSQAHGGGAASVPPGTQARSQECDNKAPGPDDKPSFPKPLAMRSLRSMNPPMTNNPRMLDGPNKTQHHLRPSKLRTSLCMPRLIQHHLNLLHASCRGNGRIGSSDLLDSGGCVPRSLQVHHQWCTGGCEAHILGITMLVCVDIFTKAVIINPQPPQPET